MAEPAARSVLPARLLRPIRVKVKVEGFVRNKAVYIALAILPDGTKEILGLWIEQTGSEVLAAGDERIEEPGLQGQSDRRRRSA